jgi:hypothetical protein
MMLMSVNIVPGWSVLIAPSVIGEPVAFTPGFGPHDEVLTDELVVLVEVAAVVVLVFLLLPHPARTIAPATTVRTSNSRTRGTRWKILNSLLLLR